MKSLEEMGQYATVVIDPPWPLAPFGPQKATDFGLDYPTLTLADIAALPVGAVCAPDSRLFLWTVNKFLPMVFDLLCGWDIQYTLTMAWVKAGGVKSPVSPMFNAEWIVVGKRGSPKWTDTKAFKTANSWPRGDHSVKPEGFYDLLRRVTPGPRLDVFGRRRIAGFDSWGDQAPEGSAPPDHYQEVLLDH